MNIMKTLLASAAIICACGATSASAEVISFDLNTTVEGVDPSGFPTATFTDAGADTVTLRLDLANLSGGEFSSGFFFNFAGDATDLSFTRTGGTGPASGRIDIDLGSNAFDTPGNQGLFDIAFGFDTGNGRGADRFAADEFLTFSVMGDGLMASMFNVASAPQQGGSNFALARIQGIANDGSASVADGNGGGGEGPNEVPVPEPGALGLLGLGIVALGFARRRKRSV